MKAGRARGTASLRQGLFRGETKGGVARPDCRGEAGALLPAGRRPWVPRCLGQWQCHDVLGLQLSSQFYSRDIDPT